MNNIKKVIDNKRTGCGIGMLSLENATAEFRPMMRITEKIKF